LVFSTTTANQYGQNPDCYGVCSVCNCIQINLIVSALGDCMATRITDVFVLKVLYNVPLSLPPPPGYRLYTVVSRLVRFID